MGGKVDSSVNKGKCPYIFRLSGQKYHCMGSLLPIDGSKPKFSQLYIYDTDNELSKRQHAFSLQRINELHLAYLALQYPLLFPYGDDGYRVDIPHRDISNIGQRVILPSSFTGGARYMMQNYLDVMSLCKWFGYPDYFITVTCNPKWPEIQRFIADTNLKPEDRPDILARLFKMKLDSLIKDLKKNSLLGSVEAVVYTVEFQKRGLPHVHICLFIHSDYKLPTVEHIDWVISAEIPNKDDDP
ncbi:unnamed protein product [Lactuca virosa]|uniref:Helitron helicase-like domain-containing protein n=1 Tax=Lactuca virosa TaxID=75947 RepID=A0AAU9MSE3_9ASTR|nr:unnamed protein product [Lactuca virosa]